MTRAEVSELFIYDIAVRDDQQRRGIGSRLTAVLREGAAAAGIQDSVVSDRTTHGGEIDAEEDLEHR